MHIAGIVKSSFVDYPGKIAFVVFTRGCNMDCYFCHNKSLLSVPDDELFCVDNILKMLKERSDFIDGVVITGGEPLIQEDLSEFIDEIKKLKLLVKLDTNGLMPKELAKIICKVDYVAMDIKCTFDKYPEVCLLNRSNNIEKLIRQSIYIIQNSGVEHEFRTTLIPDIESVHEILEIKKYINKSSYFIQKYISNTSRPDSTDRKTLKIESIKESIKNWNLHSIFYRGF